MRKHTDATRLLRFNGLALCALLATAISGVAATVTVDCTNPKAKIKTIAAGLAQLPTGGPSTLLVSGTCHETVTIKNFQYLTVQGNPTATIDGGEIIPGSDAVSILSSREVTLKDLRVTGALVGVACGHYATDQPSVCYLSNVTAENAGFGVVVHSSSFLRADRSTIQNNSWAGLVLYGVAAAAVLRGSTIQENDGGGVAVGPNGSLSLYGDDTGTPTVIQNNAIGIDAYLHGTVHASGATISGNRGEGLRLMGGSAANLVNPTITGNSGHGVRIGDLSFATWAGGQGASTNVTGNLPPDVVCDQPYSAARGLDKVMLKGGTHNCPFPEPGPLQP